MNCKNCKRQGCSFAGKSHEMSFECRLYVGKTNADLIRSMTDEEMAELFADNDCGYCRIHDLCFAKGCQINCEDVWLDWLKQEAKDIGK